MFWGTPSPVRYVQQITTASDGTWTAQVIAGLRYWVQPMTAGEFANSMQLNGATASGSFKKFKSGGLGITLGTLLTVTAFEDSPGPVTFNLIGASDLL